MTKTTDETNLTIRPSRFLSGTLWTIQVLLAFLFLSSGGLKLVLPIEAMTKQVPLPGQFLRFIGVCEVLGAFGLVLPGLLRIRQVLTPLAAAGLVIIMTGATALTLASAGLALAMMPLFVGVLAAFVAYGRWAPGRPEKLRPAGRSGEATNDVLKAAA